MPETLETETRILGLWRVTAIRRPPEIGEHYFGGPQDFKLLFSALETPYWMGRFNKTVTPFLNARGKIPKPSHYITMKCELV